MRRVVGMIALVSLVASPAFAGEPKRRESYEAVIEANDVYVRSGPGRRYYPTGKLKTGERVTVHRHDPGGWYMVSPPSGSFSWIIAKYVRRIGRDKGVLTTNNVVVRVGSFESDIRTVEQIRLSRGDEVSILAEKTLSGTRGPEKWYRIKPPRGEYRWIVGQYVRRLDAAGGKIAVNSFRKQPSGLLPSPGEGDFGETGDDPVNQEYRRPYEEGFDTEGSNGESDIVERRIIRRRTTRDPASSRTGASRGQLEEERESLRQLDARFRAILRRDTLQWEFKKLERDYGELGRSVTSPALRRHIDLRLVNIDRHRQIQTDYREFVSLTRETDDKELQLLSLRGKSQRRSSTGRRRGRRRFDGAGVIQRATTVPEGAPRHVLVSANGRILAYLQAAGGLNLDRYIGRSMGVTGKRTHRAAWHSDLIVVEKLTPVRLLP